MATTASALNALRASITAALNAAGAPPAQVYRGWPAPQAITKMLQEATPQGQVSIYPLKGQRQTRYNGAVTFVTPTVPGIAASVNGHILTLSGQPKAGDNIHAFFGSPLQDANYSVQVGNQMPAVLTVIANGINAKALPGISAAVSGSTVVLTGATFSRVNVGNGAVLVREIARVQRLVQVSIWTNDPDVRDTLHSAIETQVGGVVQNFITDVNGSAIWVQYGGDSCSDQGQESYSSFRWDLFFQLEYGLTQIIQASTVGAVQGTIVTDGSTPVTFITGGT